MPFAQTIRGLPAKEPLDPKRCLAAVRELLSELNKKVIGQERMNRRVVQAAILNGHALVQSLPGQGKTTCVKEFAETVGMTYKRIQYIPDMIPSDLQGKYILKGKGEGEQGDGGWLKWVHGPIYNNVIVADEINRAPPKVQAATLECMQERTCTTIDRPPETVYHPRARKYLETMREKRGQTCFGLPIPDPDDDRRVPFIVFATQNPIEMEGTYPLSEAQTDRFLFKVILHPPLPDSFREIVDKNLPPKPGDAKPQAADPWDEDEQGYPIWLKSACLLESIRNECIARTGSMHRVFMDEQKGLWDRVRLILALSHYRTESEEPSTVLEEGMLPASLRDPHQESLRSFLAGWNRRSLPTGLKEAVQAMLTNPLFQYVEAGSSVRGLIDWPRAAVAEAFLDEGNVLRRRHFRAVAEDVLRHRLRLKPEARAEHIDTGDLIHLLLDTLMPERPDEDADDVKPLI